MESSGTARSLSKRGWSNVEVLMPVIETAVREREQQHRESMKRESSSDDSNGTNQSELAHTPFTVIDLSTAEDWTMRHEILQMTADTISKKLAEKDFSYPGGVAGDPELLTALAFFLNSHFDPIEPVTEEQITVAPGAASCLDNLLYNVCEPGDGVLIPAPYWSANDFILRVRSGVEIIPVQVDNLDAVFTDALLDSLERDIMASKVRCKALIVCNPQNPLAQCYPSLLIEKMLQFCERHNLHYISDEIFALTRFHCPELTDPVPFRSVLSIDPDAICVSRHRVHMVWGTSKDFGQNGLRLGAMVTQNNLHLRTAVALSASNTVSSLTALAVASLLRHDDLPRLLFDRSQRLGQAYNAIICLFKKHRLPFIPAYAGLFVFVRIAPNALTWDDEARAVQRLRDGGISVAAGKSYHMPDSCKGWARVSFSLQQHALDDAIKRMDALFSSSD